MKKIDLSPYIASDDVDYDVREAVITVLFNPEQKLNAIELLKRDDLARKVRDAGDSILLEESEFDIIKRSFDMITGFQINDVEFVKRIMNSETVEVEEVKK